MSYPETKVSSEVPPRFELGSLDSESRVLTITPWDLEDESGGTKYCTYRNKELIS